MKLLVILFLLRLYARLNIFGAHFFFVKQIVYDDYFTRINYIGNFPKHLIVKQVDFHEIIFALFQTTSFAFSERNP